MHNYLATTRTKIKYWKDAKHGEMFALEITATNHATKPAAERDDLTRLTRDTESRVNRHW